MEPDSAGASADDGGRRESSWDSPILHVDMDAFFVGVEQRADPSLIGIPMFVANPSGRSVVLSASYEARRFGVHSAMPVAHAIRLCPQARIVPPRHTLYYEASKKIMEIFASYTHLVEPLSVDEAFLDVSGARRRLGSPWSIAQMIRRQIKEELNLTASVGAASTKFVAKIASARCKPDGLLVIPATQTVPYLHTLPVKALWGVGAKTRKTLEQLGITTVEQVAHTPLRTLRSALGVNGSHIYELAWGRDARSVTPERTEKSIGNEETFAQDTWDTAALHTELLRLAHKVSGRMRAACVRGRTVALKLRYADFTTLTRSRTMPVPVQNANQLYLAGKELLEALGKRPQAVRLIGLRAEGLQSVDMPVQLSFEATEESWSAAEQVMDAVERKYGEHSVRPARLLGGRAGPSSLGTSGLGPSTQGGAANPSRQGQ